ncbi:T5orf172 domain-containing protein [Nemania abortiva]|nr:T5orf172 domain-containing protein [Nemania abortiva]
MRQRFPQSEVDAGASSSFPTTLTLRIYHEKTSFAATFKERLTDGSSHESRCSCYRIPQIWIGADDSEPSRRVLFPEFPARTTIMRFVLLSTENKQKARDLCANPQFVQVSIPFRKRMQELMTAISAICEAEHLSNQFRRNVAPSSTLRPMRTTDLDRNTVSKELRAKMMSPLVPSEKGWGYIYILRSQMDTSTMSVLKIGFSKFHPEHRAHELASCLSAPEVVAHTPLIPHAKRIEALIHTELVAKRKTQVCAQCGQKHSEWFTISHLESREVVITWSQWILQEPYLDGKLSDEWRNRLQALDFGSVKPEVTMADMWWDILDGVPPRPEEQLAAYINASYSEMLNQRILGSYYEGPLKEDAQKLQEMLRGGSSDRALEIEDYHRVFDGFISNPSTFGATDQSERKPSFSSINAHDIDVLLKNAVEFQALKERHEAWKKELEAMRNLKTGAVSVSDREQGMTESPLGDATLLPVIPLKTLSKIDVLARSWIGYNPTHQGFQLLQEAFARGEWVGNTPRFRLPKGYRATKPSNDENGKTRIRPGRTVHSVTETISLGTINKDFKGQLDEAIELMGNPLARALIEKDLQRILEPFIYDYSSDPLSASNESSGDEMSIDRMSIDRMSIDDPAEQTEASTWVPGSTSKASGSVSTSDGLNLSKAKAKQWLESL